VGVDNVAYRAQLKVRFADIDNAGIVYYPRFLHYFHVALEEFFPAELGMEYSEVVRTHGIGFPTVHLETDFAKPLRFGDNIEVEVRVRRLGVSSLTWGYRVYRRGEPEVLVQGGNTTVAVLLESFTKIEIPDWLRRPLEDYQARGGGPE
jgi:4-hydroxybenzoyl-CoA thioesterase